MSEKAMAPHSITLAWKIPWTEEPGGLQSMGLEELDMAEQLHFHFLLSCIGEGNGNPLQCSCLENPRDRGASWAAVYGDTKSRTRLKRLSSSSSRHTSPPSCTSLPLPTPSHPLKLSQSPGLSSLCHTADFHGLSNFTFDKVHVSMLLSQFIPPSPSPSEITAFKTLIHNSH